MKPLNTRKMSERLRNAAIDLAGRRILVTDFHGSEQEKDFTEPANCDGLGRVRHFRRRVNQKWPPNPLPLDPACRALKMDTAETLRAQVFQNAACNWRCWYCFVDFQLLAANEKHARWVTATELVDLYLNQPNRPPMIDLTGGQPDLAPEWVLWMMEEITKRGLKQQVYLWSDDNLSNDYFWRYLSDEQRDLIRNYPLYGRVCCFKGFNEKSFTFNTLAEPDLFNNQFTLMSRLVEHQIDLYAYVTLTTPDANNIKEDIAVFVDKLQAVQPNLPLRTVPLEIKVFTPVKGRMTEAHQVAVQNQYSAIEAWRDELVRRFTDTERSMAVTEVPLGGKRGGR